MEHTQDSLSVIHLIRSMENETEASSNGFLLRFGEVKSIQPNDLVIVLQCEEKQVHVSTEDKQEDGLKPRTMFNPIRRQDLGWSNFTRFFGSVENRVQ